MGKSLLDWVSKTSQLMHPDIMQEWEEGKKHGKEKGRQWKEWGKGNPAEGGVSSAHETTSRMCAGGRGTTTWCSAQFKWPAKIAF